MAWEPYQELFQGVANCLHSDFRIGGLAPGESKSIRGKLYLSGSDVEALVKRYETDFPEHHRRQITGTIIIDRAPNGKTREFDVRDVDDSRLLG